tara:strand:+ start:285 stop:521 length:237 start_codon:yes stop_codon:yes gene_type:complete
MESDMSSDKKPTGSRPNPTVYQTTKFKARCAGLRHTLEELENSIDKPWTNREDIWELLVSLRTETRKIGAWIKKEVIT